MKFNNLIAVSSLFLAALLVSPDSAAQDDAPENHSRFKIDPALMGPNFLYADHPRLSPARQSSFSAYNSPEGVLDDYMREPVYDTSAVLLVYRPLNEDVVNGHHMISITFVDDGNGTIDANDPVVSVKKTNGGGINGKMTVYKANAEDSVNRYGAHKVKTLSTAEFNDEMQKLIGISIRLRRLEKKAVDAALTAEVK